MKKLPNPTPDDSSNFPSMGFTGQPDQWVERVREAESPPPPGCIGPYEVTAEAGRGAQGVVYRSRQPGTNRDVAIKRLTTGAFATSNARRRFEREVEILSSFNHQNIVSVFAMDVIDGTPVLAMEWVDGVPITDWCRTRRLDKNGYRSIVQVFVKVCEAVHYAHIRGVIHRDLKPSNILVDSDGEPRVLDFGLAKLSDHEGNYSSDTTTQFVGTLAYASPEQLWSASSGTDVRSDLYSIGVIMYESLVGTLPYKLGETPAATAEIVRDAEPAAPSSVNSMLPRELGAIVLKLLQKKERTATSPHEVWLTTLSDFWRGCQQPHRCVVLIIGYERLGVIEERWQSSR